MKIFENNVTIGIGEYYASSTERVIYTLLGSCVAVCLYDSENQIGGMNHILLPGNPDHDNYNASARYGINAMELLINGIMKLGGNRKKIIAKAFGGANIIPAISRELAVGEKISAFVVDFLKTEGIKLVSYDFGGNDTRKIYFNTETGDVFLKRIASTKFASIGSEEQRWLRQMKKELPSSGDTTLFTS